MVEILNTLEGFKISFNDKSKRIIDIIIEDEIIEKLIFPFNKFDIPALEYKPFTRFTLAKSLDDLTTNKFSKLINSIIKNRDSGCFILRTNNKNKLQGAISLKCLWSLLSRAIFKVMILNAKRNIT